MENVQNTTSEIDLETVISKAIQIPGCKGGSPEVLGREFCKRRG